MKKFLAQCALLAVSASAQEETTNAPYEAPHVDGVLFLESFQDEEHAFVPSTAEKYADQATKYSAGQKESVAVGIDGDRALYFNKPSHFGLTAKVDDIAPNGGDLVFQYEVRFTEDVTCGGAYLKFLDGNKFSDPTKLDNESPYIVMFGPDKCGSGTDKVHFILRHENPKSGVWSEHHFNNPPKIKTDKYSHLYTLVIHHDNTFEVKIDNVVEATGSLFDDMTPPVNPPKQIDDPEDKKPADWVDEAKIKDPEASKPEDWDEEAPKQIEDMSVNKPEGWWDDEPEEIPDPTAEMPEDWDEEDDGVWEAPNIPNPKCKNPGCGEWQRPLIDNPEYKGKWIHPMIDNPDYEGEWTPRQIDNPHFFVDENPADFPAIGAVAIEVMSNFAGTSFDNVLIASSSDAASEFASKTFTVKAEAEKTRSEDKARAQRHADRLKLLEDGSFGGKVQYYAGEAFEAVRSNPIAAVVTLIAVIVATIVSICKCCCADDFDGDSEATDPAPQSEPELESENAKSKTDNAATKTETETTKAKDDGDEDVPEIDDEETQDKEADKDGKKNTIGTPKKSESTSPKKPSGKSRKEKD